MPDAALALPRRARTRRRWPWLALAVVLVVGGGTATALAARTAPALPRGGEVEVRTPVGRTVFVGVLGPLGDDRRLDLVGVGGLDGGVPDGVSVATAPVICRDGSINVTSDLDAFCPVVVPAEGEELGPRDQLVVAVTVDRPGTLVLSGVELAWEEGFGSGAQRVGPRIAVEVVG